jgi:alkylhydroperoxidase family enzyme
LRGTLNLRKELTMSYVENPAPGPTEMDQVYGLRPRFYAVFMEDYHRSIERIDPVLLELCRLRMATLIESKLDLSLRYQPAIAAGLTEAKLAELPRYSSSAVFTDRERRCLEFAEQFVIQSSSINDDDAARLQSVLDAETFIYFVKALSVMDQLQRGCAAFRIEPSRTAPTRMKNFLTTAQAVR